MIGVIECEASVVGFKVEMRLSSEAGKKYQRAAVGCRLGGGGFPFLADHASGSTRLITVDSTLVVDSTSCRRFYSCCLFFVVYIFYFCTFLLLNINLLWCSSK